MRKTLFLVAILWVLAGIFYADATTTVTSDGCKNVVTDYGADPTGSADSTTAFNNAIAGTNNLYVPSGSYKCSGQLVFNNSPISQFHMFGEPSAPPTIFLKSSSGLSGPFFYVGGQGYATFNSFFWYFHDLNITVDSSNTGCTAAVFWSTAQETSMRNVTITVQSSGPVCLLTGDNGFAGTGGGGTTFQNVTLNGLSGTGQTAQINQCAETVFRGVTSNGSFVFNGNGPASFISCTFNNPGATGITTSTAPYASFINCTLTSTTTKSLGTAYHLENSFGSTQLTSSNVYYNGTSESGSSSNLNSLSTIGNVPNPTSLVPTTACVDVSTLPTPILPNGSDMTSAMNTALAGSNTEFYFPPGTYVFSSTIAFPGTKTVTFYGCTPASWGTILQFNGTPGCTVAGAGTGNATNFCRLRLYGHGTQTVMDWNGDSSSQLIDVGIQKDASGSGSTNPVWIAQTGGFYLEQMDPTVYGNNLATNTWLQYNASGPAYIVGVNPEHFNGPHLVINNAADLRIEMMQFEFVTGWSANPITVTNSQNIVFDETWGGGTTFSELMTLDTSSSLSLWGGSISGGNELLWNSTSYASQLVGFAIPGPSLNIPSAPGTLSTVGFSTPDAPLTLTTVP